VADDKPNSEPTLTQPPSVGALVQAISEDALAVAAASSATPPAKPAARPVVGVAIGKPQPLTLVLVFLALILIIIFSLLIVSMFMHVGELMGEIRAKKFRDNHPVVEPLPPSTELRDARLFTQWLERRPRDVLYLYAGRVQAFYDAQDWDLVIRTGEETYAVTAKLLPLPQRVAYADALVQRERIHEADSVLRTISFHELPSDLTAKAHQVLSRLELVRQRHEARLRTAKSSKP
jgi:hypothetical protein